jgi:hypothetical protein
VPAGAAAQGNGNGNGGGNQNNNNISVAATGPVTFARSTTVTGKVTGSGNSGISVDLQADPFPFDDNGFSQVATGTTDANGDYRFTNKPAMHTRYRAVAKASPTITSQVVTVLVRLQVKLSISDRTPDAGDRVRFSGTVCPEHDGKLAYIQRRTSSGSYRTVTRATLADTGGPCSSYAKRLRISRDGVYRVKVPSRDADHSTGTSRRLSVNAH